VALPIDDLPMSADPDEAARFSGALDGIADGTGAAAVLLVLERPGPADLTPTEAAWVRNVRRALDGRRTGLHGLVLVHDGGMCLRDEHASIAGRTVARSSRAG
jgi:hypothetical protein